MIFYKKSVNQICTNRPVVGICEVVVFASFEVIRVGQKKQQQFLVVAVVS